MNIFEVFYDHPAVDDAGDFSGFAEIGEAVTRKDFFQRLEVERFGDFSGRVAKIQNNRRVDFEGNGFFSNTIFF